MIISMELRNVDPRNEKNTAVYEIERFLDRCDPSDVVTIAISVIDDIDNGRRA